MKLLPELLLHKKVCPAVGFRTACSLDASTPQAQELRGAAAEPKKGRIKFDKRIAHDSECICTKTSVTPPP